MIVKIYISRHLPALLLVVFLSCSSRNSQLANEIIEEIQLPEGFQIEIFAKDIDNARSMAWGSEGGNILFVGSRKAGNVYAVVDENGDYKADTAYIIASGLRQPNGVAFLDGNLFVAEISRVLKFENIEQQLANPPEAQVIYDEYPTEGHHGWKYIAFGPDGKLYVPVGAPCNICKSEDPVFASITRMNPDGTGMEIFAEGVRNTVGFDWHPVTGELWFTDNGRDWLGDNRPPDELNHAPLKGMHFGYPYCHGEGLQDPEYGDEACGSFVPPVQELGPHVAALGMLFYTGDMFPEEYRNTIFIAEHGSWNRTKPIGYRVTTVSLDENNKSLGYDVFADGWLQQSRKLGRPVDVLQAPDGSVLVSDDDADVIYRISYNQ